MSKISLDLSLLASELEDHKFDKCMLIDALDLCLVALNETDGSYARARAITRANKVLECIIK
jgi:hypothetical protein